MGMFDTFLDKVGLWLSRRVSAVATTYEPYAASRIDLVARVIQPGDVLLVEGGRSKISSAIKYLTQSTWSHAALYVGAMPQFGEEGKPIPSLIEAELGEGVIASPLEKYASFNTRICRPIGLTPEDRAALIAYATARIGDQYDTRNVIDLVRFLLPNPPVPARFRRRMISLGSGEPTRVICSTLIARAFQLVRYPILPRIEQRTEIDEMGHTRHREVLHIRHSSLYTPRDFDVSPYFRVIKPTVELGFDYKSVEWGGVVVTPAPEKAGRFP